MLCLQVILFQHNLPKSRKNQIPMIFLGLEKQVHAGSCDNSAIRTCGDLHEPYAFYFFFCLNDIWVQLGHIQVNIIRSADHSI